MNHNIFSTPRQLKGKEDTLKLVAELLNLAEHSAYKVDEVRVEQHHDSSMPTAVIKIMMVGKAIPYTLTHASDLAPGNKYTSPIITHSEPAIIKPKRKKPTRRTHAKKA